MPRPRLFIVFLLVAVCRLTAAPSLDVHPTDSPPVIDGVLDDAAWLDGAHSEAFRQIYPGEGTEPSERTEFWVTYDANNIYIAVRCHDSGGLAGIRAYSMQRDLTNGSDDEVKVVIDTFNRKSDGYYFGLTAAGGYLDGLVQNKSERNDQWDGLWHGRVSHDEGGWSAEFAIPTKSIAFNPENSSWGFDVARTIRRKQETVRWSNHIRARSVYPLPDVGELQGFAGLQQGRGIELRPFASMTGRSQPGPDQNEFTFKPGLDVLWQATPSLAATFTINTDFADAEVDEREVNLSRFPLFFPEKRSFFNQDASLFTFAGLQRNPLPFFSRRIGRANDGTEIDILAGAKITGRAGPWTLGLLDVQTDKSSAAPAGNLFVGRVAHEVLGESSVGLIVTNGDPSSKGDNTLIGVDFNYTNTHFRGDKTLRLRSGIQATHSDRAGGDGTAFSVKLDYPNEPLTIYGTFRRVEERFDPALGFVSRTGVMYLNVVTWSDTFSETGFLRITEPFIEIEATTDLDFNLLDTSIFPGFFMETRSGDFANFWVATHRETFDQSFNMLPGVVVPVGVHKWTNGQIQMGTSRSRPVDVYVRWRHGGYLNGNADTYNIGLGWRPTPALSIKFNEEVNDIRLPGGAFKVQVGSAKINYTVSPDLQFSLLGQYDNLSESLGMNFRIKWTPQPGNDFYLVVNQGYDTTNDQFRPTQGEASIKGTWTLRF